MLKADRSARPRFSLSRRRSLIATLLGVGMLGLALPQSQLFASSPNAVPGVQAGGALLVSGHMVSPAGTQTRLWNLPMGAALSPDGSHLLIANSGAYDPEMLQVLDTVTGKVVQNIPYRAPDGAETGVVYSPDGTHAYVASGGKDVVHTYYVNGSGAINPGNADRRPGTLGPAGDISVGAGNGSTWPMGLAVTPDGATLLVANNLADTVSVVDTGSQQVKATIPVGHYPYTVAVAPDGKHAYVSNWEDGTVGVIDVTAAAAAIANAAKTPLAIKGGGATINVGNHPTAMVFGPGGLLYVANANSDSISVIDTAANTVTRTISVSPYTQAPLSSTPLSLALSKDGKTLYAALAGENAVAVVDTAAGTVRGRVPTAWYPSSVTLSKDGTTMWVTNAKGLGGGPNGSPTTGPNPTRKVPYDSYCNCVQNQYTGSMIVGTLSTVPVPGTGQLATYTAEVAHNNRLDAASMKLLMERSAGNPIPVPGGATPFKHVIYINKENRTFDQVFGDEQGGNVDPNLVLFGRKVTPNLHALAERFGLLDNFYADAEVSADGHNWINGAYASDYNEKMWPLDYSWGPGRNRSYDFEGTSRINLNPGGYLWDAAHEAGISYRDYGNFIAFGANHFTKPTLIPASASCDGPVATSYLAKGLISLPAGKVLCFKPEQVLAQNNPNLAGHQDPRFRTFDMRYREADRFAEWQREFNHYVASGTLPSLEFLRFTSDHTSGTVVGALTPQAYVAENDLAVGKVVEAVSHSPYWKDTLIVVTEDDAQNGPDHVDGHRTTSLIISAYNAHSSLTVDHTLYDTAAMVRTVELVLGLRPLSQFDASATPMWRLFSSAPDLTPYTAGAESITPATYNLPSAAAAGISSSLNFAQEDRAPADLLNRIIWHGVKGASSTYPVTHYSLHGSDEK